MYSIRNKSRNTENRFDKWEDAVKFLISVASVYPNDQIVVEDIETISKGSARQVLKFYVR